MTVQEAAKQAGVGPTTIKDWLRNGRISGAKKVERRWVIPDDWKPDAPQVHEPGKPSTPPAEYEKFDGSTKEMFRLSPERVNNLDDLKRVCQIDTTEWTVKSYEQSSYQVLYKDGDGEGHVEQLYGVRVKLAPNTAGILGKMFVEELRESAKKSPRVIKKAKPAGTGLALELGLYDHHFGALCWGQETGWGDYDLNIATKFWHDAIEVILSRVSGLKFDRVYLVTGNDMANIDSRKNETFAGTPQDGDSRYRKLARHIRSQLVETIDRLASHIAPVEVKPIPGNHDSETTLWLADVLDAHYRLAKHVDIDLAPTSRKYIEWGRNLVMLAHGDAVRGKAGLLGLANLMAAERPQAWGRTKWKEVHSGHVHHEVTVANYNVTIRRLMSLQPPSAWAAHNGYVGAPRGAEGFVWSKDEGLINQPRYNAE